MSCAADEVISRFRENRICSSSPIDRAKVFYEGDTIYSYGRHFVLAFRGDFGRGVNYIINADRYSRTTANHTASCIQFLKPSVQIPFSALNRLREDGHHFGPEPGTLRVIDRNESRVYYTCPVCGKEVDRETEFQVRGYSAQHSKDGQRCHLTIPSGRGVVWQHDLGAALFTLEHELNGDTETRFYLSAFDGNERRGYFMVRLPKPVKTVAAALASLKPARVRRAERAGQEVRRQGEFFFIRTAFGRLPVAKRDNMARHWLMRPGEDQPSDHIAQQAVQLGPQLLVRGTIRHDHRRGGRRAGDHAPLRLGTENWWLPVVNEAVARFGAPHALFAADGNVD